MGCFTYFGMSLLYKQRRNMSSEKRSHLFLLLYAVSCHLVPFSIMVELCYYQRFLLNPTSILMLCLIWTPVVLFFSQVLKMALFNRIGNMLKQSVSRHTNLELCATRTSLYQAIRSMSSSKLFVGGKRILFPVVCSCYVLFPSFCCSIMAPTIPCRSLIWH